jgi:integral membrane protein (TIGR01906 family)
LKFVRTIADWLFVICLPLLFLTSTVRLGISSMHIYEYGFNKYGISEVTNIDRTQLNQVARKLIDYFNSKTETPQIMVVNKDGEQFELFHDYELIHLEDVKGLIQLDYRIQVASLAYIVVYGLLFLLWRKGRWQDLARGVRWGCALSLVFIAALGIASIFNFERLFIQFHLISFSNPYWLLDPSKDYLIMLFPAGFWQDIAFLGGGTIAAEALILGGIAWAVPVIYRKHRRSSQVAH